MSEAGRIFALLISIITFAGAMILIGRTMQRMTELENRFDRHDKWAGVEVETIKTELQQIYARRDMVTLEFGALKSRLDRMSQQLDVLLERRMEKRPDVA